MTDKPMVRCTGAPGCGDKDCEMFDPHEPCEPEWICYIWAECLSAGPGRNGREFKRVRCVRVKESK